MTQLRNSSTAHFKSFFRRIFWHEVGMISLYVMELTWILPWFRSITPVIQARTGNSSFFALLVFLLVVAYVNRILRIFQLRPLTHRLIMIAVFVLGFYSLSKILVYPDSGFGFWEILYHTFDSLQYTLSIIPEGIIVILMTIYLWWRGIVISTGSVEIRTTERRFRFGILTLAAFAIFFRGNHLNFLLSVMPIYFAAGLLAIAFSRTSSIGRGVITFRLPYTGSWLVGMIAITAFTVGVGLIVSQWIQSEPAYLIYGFFSERFNDLLTYVIIILLPIIEALVYVVHKLLEFIRQFLEPGLSEPLNGLSELEQPTPEFSFEQGEPAFQMPPEAIAAIVILVLVGLVVLLVRRANRQQRYGIPEFIDDGETVYESGAIRSRIQKLLKQVREGFDTIRKFGVGRRMIAATVIRRIYRRLLDLAAELGRPRDPAETPYEFQEKLLQIFPNQKDQIELVTNAYVHVRYGEIPEEDRIIVLVEEAWSSIEKEARSLRRTIHA